MIVDAILSSERSHRVITAGDKQLSARRKLPNLCRGLLANVFFNLIISLKWRFCRELFMSEYQLIGRISLTEAEEKLYRQIPNLKERIRNRDYLEAGEWERIADCMECLADSLIERNAIHPNRLRIFDSKDAAERGKKSTKERFESNGKVDREILRHPHFLETLRYFVEGPDLPKEAMTRFIDILDSCDTNGGIVKKSLIHVRATV